MKTTTLICFLFMLLPELVQAEKATGTLAAASASISKAKAIRASSYDSVDIPNPKAEAALKNRISLPEGSRSTEGMESVPLFLEELNVVGLYAYSQRDLQRLMQSVVAKHLSLGAKKKNIKPVVHKGKSKGSYRIVVESEVLLSFAYLLSEEITKLYQNNQYFLSRAIIPAQDINQERGNIEICAIEGKVSQNLSVTIKDKDDGTGAAQRLKVLKSSISNRLKKLTRSQQGALKFSQFERQLLLIRDMPGVNISTTFRQPPLSKQKVTNCADSLAQGAGVTDLSVSIGLDQFDGAISVDNYGTESTGPWFMRMNFGASSQVFSGDRYALDISVSNDGKELKNYGLSSAVPLNSNGTLLQLSYRKGEAAPGADFSPLEVDNKTQTVSVGIDHSIKRSRRENVSFFIGLEHQNIDTSLLEVPFLQDKIRSINTSLTYDFADRVGGIHYGTLGVSKGLNIDNATPKNAVLSSRPEAKPSFGKLTGEYRHYKRLNTASSLKGHLTWINSLNVQFANEPLYASEEFELGGRNYGRGADIGVISGDRGVAIKSQLDYEYKRWGGDVKLSLFADYGKAWNLDLSNIGTEDEEASLTTTGISFGYENENNWYLNLEASKPVQITGDRSTDAKVYLDFGYRY